jgi:predicted site-specific integrase-resolvase
MATLHTTTEAAASLRTSPKVVRRYIAEGRLEVKATARGAALVDAGDVDRLRLELIAEAEKRAADLKASAS